MLMRALYRLILLLMARARKAGSHRFYLCKANKVVDVASFLLYRHVETRSPLTNNCEHFFPLLITYTVKMFSCSVASQCVKKCAASWLLSEIGSVVS